MSAPEKCPKCRAAFVQVEMDDWGDRVLNYARFKCETTVYEDRQLRLQGHFCIINERDQLATELQTLRTANAALVERVHAAEAILTNPHALWANWIRGTVKLPDGIGDIRECSEKMKRFRSRWLAAHQELRKAEDRIERAKERVKRLEEAGDAMATAYEEILFDNYDATILENYRKVRSEEGKP